MCAKPEFGPKSSISPNWLNVGCYSTTMARQSVPMHYFACDEAARVGRYLISSGEAIDTPETKKPGYTVGCWGPEATTFATSALLGQRVAFTTDPSQGVYDRYGRTLAYLDEADGWDYSIEAARAGVAHSYVYHGVPSARAGEIAAAEQEAKAAGRGLWGPPCFGETTSVPR